MTAGLRAFERWAERRLEQFAAQADANADDLAALCPEQSRGLTPAAKRRSARRFTFAMSAAQTLSGRRRGEKEDALRHLGEWLAPRLLGCSLHPDTVRRLTRKLAAGPCVFFDHRGVKRRQRRAPVNRELFATYIELRAGGCPPKRAWRAVRRVARGRAWPRASSVEARYQGEIVKGGGR